MTQLALPARARHVPALGAEATLVLGLFAFRWLAGIAENLAIPAFSQLAALALLAGLALMTLYRMRLAEDCTLFLTGILAWVATGIASFAANPAADARTTMALLTLLALYALFANAALTHLRTPQALVWLYRLLALFITAGFALSALQIATGTGFVEAGKANIQRAYGSDVHPVSFAIQITAALVAFEIARTRLGRPFTALHLAIMGAGAITLYLTYARTAWLMALIIAALALISRGSWTRRLLLGGAGALAGSALLVTSDRFTDLSSLPLFLANFSPADMVFDWRYIDNSLSWRIVNWSLGFTQAMEQPILGFGPGQSAMSSYFNLEMHNIFLEALFEGGVFGLAALLLTLAGLARLHRRLPRQSACDRYSRTLANGFGLTLLLAVTFSTSFVDQLMSFLLYILLLGAAANPGNAGAGSSTP